MKTLALILALILASLVVLPVSAHAKGSGHAGHPFGAHSGSHSKGGVHLPAHHSFASGTHHHAGGQILSTWGKGSHVRLAK